MTKCDFCPAPFKYYTEQQLCLYCDSPECVARAEKILDNWHEECERAMRDYYNMGDRKDGETT